MHSLVLILSCAILGACAQGYGYGYGYGFGYGSDSAPKKEESRGYGYAPAPKKAEPSGYGYSSYEKVDPAAPYEMNYDITDDYGNQRWRKESGDAYNNKEGSYGYRNAYGLYRAVKYWADDSGFHVTVDTNEPGVGEDNPADAEFTVKETPKNVYEGHGKHSGYGYGNAHGSGYEKVTAKMESSSGYGYGHGDGYGKRDNGYGHGHGYGKTVKVVKIEKKAPAPAPAPAPVHNNGYGEPKHVSGYGTNSGHDKGSAYVHQQRHGKNPFEYTSRW